MEKIWLKSYPEGVPEQIDKSSFSSLKKFIEHCCKEFADQPAFTNFGKSISYSDLDRMSRKFGAFLQHEVGLNKGDRVALMMPNILQYPVCLSGLLRAGFTAVNVNPLYTARELKHQLNDSGATAIVIVENFCATLQKVIGDTAIKTVVTTQIGDFLGAPKAQIMNFVIRNIKKMIPPLKIEGTMTLMSAMHAGADHEFTNVNLDHDDIAFLQYTGGTTGVAKGAVLTHGNLVSNVLQAGAWLGSGTDVGNQIVITALPLYHIFSLTANCLTFMLLGGNNILITNPRDIPAFVTELGKHKFTVITGVNTLFNSLLHDPGFKDLDFSALSVSLGGGMAVQKAVADEWKAVTGNPLTQAYGLTETSPAATMNPFELNGFNGSIGLPISSTEVTIRNEEGVELVVGEIGEICIRGPQVMRGYWNRPDETEKVMIGDWFRTGDAGRMDDAGFVYIEDRIKDMINVSGFNVYPNEIEDVVVSHPLVSEVAAVGVPSERSGEVVKLFVVRENESLTEQELQEYCRERLTAYKCPKHIEFRDELPKTNVGKILRRALREEKEDE